MVNCYVVQVQKKYSPSTSESVISAISKFMCFVIFPILSHILCHSSCYIMVVLMPLTHTVSVNCGWVSKLLYNFLLIIKTSAPLSITADNWIPLTSTGKYKIMVSIVTLLLQWGCIKLFPGYLFCCNHIHLLVAGLTLESDSGEEVAL
jgi:hypothetical protein